MGMETGNVPAVLVSLGSSFVQLRTIHVSTLGHLLSVPKESPLFRTLCPRWTSLCLCQLDQSVCWTHGDSLGSSGGPAGLLTLIAPLDYEASRAHYLSVEGSRGKPSLSDVTTVIVNVTDVNDNSPVFEDGGYSVEVMEDLPPGAPVTKVGARTSPAAVASSSR